MGINVSTSMGFENREFLKNTAKNILQKKGADKNSAEEIVNNALFEKNEISSSSLSVLKASAQVTLNNSLKETLNYLKAHANDKRKKEYILGDLWQNLSENEDTYQGELVDFVIDTSLKNIFAA